MLHRAPDRSRIREDESATLPQHLDVIAHMPDRDGEDLRELVGTPSLSDFVQCPQDLAAKGLSQSPDEVVLRSLIAVRGLGPALRHLVVTVLSFHGDVAPVES